MVIYLWQLISGPISRGNDYVTVWYIQRCYCIGYRTPGARLLAYIHSGRSVHVGEKWGEGCYVQYLHLLIRQ